MDDGNGEGKVSQSIQLDELGPVVVGSNGTVSRISNWKEMTVEEQERTARVISKRNASRLAKLETSI